ncbi:hypothetical protein OQJ65_17145 [Vibrio sp. Sgm 22]|uniref:right-handed parallel beta-helix repeat-containing protein n=1 Tax=unclassified Vibrio TaxID=2614977 RepID=UPI0022498B37|nr:MULTISPECIES: right-handed parallel beta-helix repeat-containing protein [unclassified Vibrio]MCX2760062.1 hypothetical protein [Vibrio sp. 14G-20]MCX2777050.1 hypothetical protein [Vibrio sp. Sgm 22]
MKKLALTLITASILAGCGGGSAQSNPDSGVPVTPIEPSDPIEPIENLAPIAVVDAEELTYRYQPAIISGVDSYDPDETADITYDWTITSKPDGSNAVFSKADMTAEFTPDLPGDYTVELVVSDGDKLSKPISATIKAGTVISGDYVQDLTLTPKDSPYLVSGSVIINYGTTLTAEGVEVYAIKGHGGISVFGDMVVNNSVVKGTGISNQGEKVDEPSSIKITNSELDNNSFPANASSRGSIIVTDSVITGTEELAPYVWYPVHYQVERNVFKSPVWFSIGLNDGYKASIKNNRFENSLTMKSWAGYQYAGVIFQYNTFEELPRLILNGNQSKIDARENYWPTDDTDAIDEAISDGNDAGNINNIIEYRPMLQEPHVDTPAVGTEHVEDY